jgi:cytochrome c-type biogenesis protein CcmF
MGMGPLLNYGKEGARKVFRGTIIPAIVAAIAAIAAWIIGYHNPWALICAAIAGAAVTAVIFDFTRQLITRSRNENPIVAFFRLIDGNHRRYGAQIVHMGMVLIAIGVTGSGVFSQKQTFQLNAGQSANFDGFKITLNTIGHARRVNYVSTEADVTVTDAKGVSLTLKPERRVYDKWEEQTSSVVAIGSNWQRDLYVNLAGWDEGATNVAIEIFVNPLVKWIWTGGWVLAIGTIVCMCPSIESLFKSAAAAASERAEETEISAKPSTNGHKAAKRQPAAVAR